MFRKERTVIRKDWKGYGEKLFRSLNEGSERVILLLDEVSFLLEDMITEMGTEGASDLLSWFASIRKKMNRISYVFSGSEHLPTFLHSHHIEGELQDMSFEHLNLFDNTSAEELTELIMAGQGIIISRQDIDRILSLTGQSYPLLSSACLGHSDCFLQNTRKSYRREDRRDLLSKSLGAGEKEVLRIHLSASGKI